MPLLIGLIGLAGACDPVITPVGDLLPASGTYHTELESTALPPPWSQTLCGNPAGVSQLFVSGGGNWLLSARSDQLGTVQPSVRTIPSPTDTFPCTGNMFPTYTAFTDHNISRLPAGRLVNTNLANKRGPGSICVDPQGLAIVERAIYVRTSNDCGSTWDVNVVDASDIGSPQPSGFPFIDRQSLFVDPEQHTMYLAFRTAQGLVGDNQGGGLQRSVVLRASTDAATPTWSTVVSRLETNAPGVTAMTARQDDGSQSLMLLQCAGLGVPPRLTRVDNPVTSGSSGATTHDVAFATLTGLPACDIVQGPLTTTSLWNVLPQLSVAPLAAGSEQYRLVYPDVVARDGVFYQILRVADVQLDLGSNPIQGTVIRLHTIDRSSADAHVLWPDLVYSEGFETSLGVAYQQVLTYNEVDSRGVETVRTEIWRNAAEGWLAPQVLQSPTTIQPALLGNILDSKFFGDYKEGTFVDDSSGRGTFFVPWSRTLFGQGTTPDGEIFGALVQP